MDRKSFHRVELKDADQGIVSAVFSSFDVVDLDGDIVSKEAFTGKDGVRVPVSAYGHKSWEGMPPVGVASVKVTDGEAIADMQFNLKTQAGRDTFEVIKQMGDLQEYSWGFTVKESDQDEVEGKSVRVIKSVDIHEVSPVMMGAAGPGRTRTLAYKSAKYDEDPSRRIVPAVKGSLPVHETHVVAMPWDGSKTVKALPDDARPSELRSVYAWVDPEGDPEMKSSYWLAHHHGVDGPANIRACLIGIAELNGTKGASLSKEQRKTAYDHLSSHLRDADREPPELRTVPGVSKSNQRFGDEASEVMANLSALIDRATEVMALRAQKGRGMSPAAADLLSWVADELKRLNTLLENPVEDDKPDVSDDELASLWLASVARLNEAA